MQLTTEVKERLITINCIFTTCFLLVFGGLPCIIIACIMYIMNPFIPIHTTRMFVAYWSAVYFKLIIWSSRVKLYVSGIENLQKTKEEHYVFASNHISFLDIPLLYSLLPYSIVSVVKKELSYIPIFGYLAQLSGAIFIDRKDTQKSIANINKAIEKNRLCPRSILIFPEGKRSHDKNIQDFKSGAFVIAQELQYPIIPIYIEGCHEVVGKNLNFTGKINLSKSIFITIGEKIIDTTNDKNKLKDIAYHQMHMLKNKWNAPYRPFSLSLYDCFRANR